MVHTEHTEANESELRSELPSLLWFANNFRNEAAKCLRKKAKANYIRDQDKLAGKAVAYERCAKALEAAAADGPMKGQDGTEPHVRDE